MPASTPACMAATSAFLTSPKISATVPSTSQHPGWWEAENRAADAERRGGRRTWPEVRVDTRARCEARQKCVCIEISDAAAVIVGGRKHGNGSN
eukprot:120565-Pelagomonas_calceolata.AAC.3